MEQKKRNEDEGSDKEDLAGNKHEKEQVRRCYQHLTWDGIKPNMENRFKKNRKAQVSLQNIGS